MPAAQCVGLALGLVWVLISHVTRVQANREVVLVNAVQQAANDGPDHGQRASKACWPPVVKEDATR